MCAMFLHYARGYGKAQGQTWIIPSSKQAQPYIAQVCLLYSKVLLTAAK